MNNLAILATSYARVDHFSQTNLELGVRLEQLRYCIAHLGLLTSVKSLVFTFTNNVKLCKSIENLSILPVQN